MPSFGEYVTSSMGLAAGDFVAESSGKPRKSPTENHFHLFQKTFQDILVEREPVFDHCVYVVVPRKMERVRLSLT